MAGNLHLLASLKFVLIFFYLRMFLLDNWQGVYVFFFSGFYEDFCEGVVILLKLCYRFIVVELMLLLSF